MLHHLWSCATHFTHLYFIFSCGGSYPPPLLSLQNNIHKKQRGNLVIFKQSFKFMQVTKCIANNSQFAFNVLLLCWDTFINVKSPLLLKLCRVIFMLDAHNSVWSIFIVWPSKTTWWNVHSCNLLAWVWITNSLENQEKSAMLPLQWVLSLFQEILDVLVSISIYLLLKYKCKFWHKTRKVLGLLRKKRPICPVATISFLRSY
jgi:hypothetical protein